MASGVQAVLHSVSDTDKANTTTMQSVGYWVCTGLVAFFIGSGGLAYASQVSDVVQGAVALAHRRAAIDRRLAGRVMGTPTRKPTPVSSRSHCRAKRRSRLIGCPKPTAENAFYLLPRPASSYQVRVRKAIKS